MALTLEGTRELSGEQRAMPCAWLGGEMQQVRKGKPSPSAGMLGTARLVGALDNGLAV